MKVGVPKEIKTLEFRVGLTPAGVRELVHDVTSSSLKTTQVWALA